MSEFTNKHKYYFGKDKLILELSRSNPLEAFRMMFDTYHKPLCLYAVQLTDSFSLAEDIVQELFVTLWEKKTYLNIAVSLHSYLFSSVRNNSYALLRKNNLIPLDQILSADIEYTDSLYNEEELREKEAEIMKELQKLPKQELAVVQAVILEDRTYKEAARELQISVNTIKTYLSRALKRLRKLDYYIYIIW